MTLIIQLFQLYLKPLFIGILAFFTVFLWRRNKNLKKEITTLDKNMDEIKKVINVQTQIIDVTKNTKPTNIAGNVERMRKNKL